MENKMDIVSVFRDLAIIIISAKLFGMLARTLRAPQVVGEIIAGLIIGPSILGWVGQTDAIAFMAEIGVVILMFVAGLETDLKEMIKTGPVALLLACTGVVVPLIAGTVYYQCFYGWSAVGTEGFFKAVFIGTIMTATSVSITVQTLRELGKLKGKVGTTILNAAIIDDVIGIIVLTFVIGLKDPSQKPTTVIVNTLLFFLFSGIVGFISYQIFKYIDKIAFHKKRIPIFSLAFCFGFAYIAEEWFGIADITGAYIAGIVLCSIKDSKYVSEQMDITSYILFGPIFFASIGLKTELSTITGEMLLFSLGFVIVALLGKVMGCGAVARLCRFSIKDSLKIGVGMMTRGEVALIVAQKGLSAGLIEAQYFAPVILLIICSSIATPIIMKLLYKGETSGPRYYEAKQQ